MSTNSETHIRAAAAAALTAARQQGRRQWAAVRLSTPRGAPPVTPDEGADRFFWDQPGRAQRIVAIGCTQALEFEGAERFPQSARAASDLYRDLHLSGDDAPTRAGPLLVGGFAFAHQAPRDPCWRGFPAARLVLPARLFVSRAEASWWTVTCSVEPQDSQEAACARLRGELEQCLREAPVGPSAASEPSADYRLQSEHARADYEQRVALALREITSGEFEKVVVARSLLLRQSRGWRVEALLERLRSAHASSTTFALGRGDAIFLGASPELLLRLEGGRLESAALGVTRVPRRL